MDITPRKFLSLPIPLQHKIASEVIQKIALGDDDKMNFYRQIESSLHLPLLSFDSYEEVSARFHLHKTTAGLDSCESSLLYVKRKDVESQEPFLPIHIALCSLRSAFNVGSIVRTTEAFRLGTLHCLGSTPLPTHPKVEKTAMGAVVPFVVEADLESLPRPWIALETTSPSSSIYEFDFPSSFTLFLGNEEFGIPQEILVKCDHRVEIPLVGSKNSLNVASAFAIAAGIIRHKIKKI